jgi:hypothetical protein
MAKGFFRRFTERISTSVEKITSTVTRPFKKEPKAPQPKKAPKKAAPAPKPTPTPTPKPKPSPAVAREQLMAKLQDMYWLQRKWDAAAMSKRINKMTDEQVYAALDLSENDIETAARMDPRAHPEYAAPDDPNSNVLWYHGGETMTV